MTKEQVARHLYFAMRIIFVFLLLCVSQYNVRAQVFEQMDSCSRENVVVADGFWKGWYVQMGLDMTLQNPYGYDFSKVFPNGKSFGLDIAVGKWFSPEFGAKFKVNWNNVIIRETHNIWYKPYGVPGGNHDDDRDHQLRPDLVHGLRKELRLRHPVRFCQTGDPQKELPGEASVTAWYASTR